MQQQWKPLQRMGPPPPPPAVVPPKNFEKYIEEKNNALSEKEATFYFVQLIIALRARHSTNRVPNPATLTDITMHKLLGLEFPLLKCDKWKERPEKDIPEDVFKELCIADIRGAAEDFRFMTKNSQVSAEMKAILESIDSTKCPSTEDLLANEWVHKDLPKRAPPPPPPGIPARPPGMPLPKLPGFVGALKPPVWEEGEVARPHAFLPEDDGPVFNGYVWRD